MAEDTFIQKVKSEIANNKLVKYGLIAVASIGGIALLWFLYSLVITGPANRKTNDAVVLGNNLMKKDSTNAAIAEFEKVVKKHDGSKAVNQAKVKLARLYMDKGDFKKAFNLLEDSKMSDTYGPAIIAGLKGDCQSEMKNYKKALEFYEEAFEASENEQTTPFYLFKAGMHAEEVNDLQKAGDYYKRIRDEYSAFASQKTIDKYIARVTAEIED
jgi:tetratricopeptide (TPR) repeat protein